MSDTGRRISRRCMLAGLAALGASSYGSKASAAPKAVKISIGRQPWGGSNSFETEYMIRNRLVEKNAGLLGLNLELEWRDYPTAIPMVEAFVSGSLDFGLWGNTPIVRGIAQSQPWSVLSLAEGRLRFVLATRPDSGIHNVQDLKGKVVGATIGGDSFNALSQMVKMELGTSIADAGIRVVNTPTQAQAAAMPTGMAAAVVIYPAFLKAEQELGIIGIVNSYGTTESGYQGSAGSGPGIALPSARKSPFYPEGFYIHRTFWMARNQVLEAQPDATVAFLMAQQQAVAALSKMKASDAAALSASYWGLSPELGARIVEDELVLKRRWIWPTEGDARALVALSGFMAEAKMVPGPLTMAQVKSAFEKSAVLNKTAWQRSGEQPPVATFTDPEAQDIRGIPVWDLANWKA